jgi:hypothetical protein
MVSDRVFSRHAFLHLHLPTHIPPTMPAQPLINLGYRPGVQLTPSKRNKIVRMRLGGSTPKDIAEATKIPLSLVSLTGVVWLTSYSGVFRLGLACTHMSFNVSFSSQLLP